jgi:hypothetical protein
MRYSLRRALSLDSVDGCTHNPGRSEADAKAWASTRDDKSGRGGSQVRQFGLCSASIAPVFREYLPC